MSTLAPVSGAVTVTGRLTLATSGDWLKKVLAQNVLAQKGPSQKILSVDLAGVTEIDSSALAFVTSVHRLLSEQNCQVEWLNIPASIHGVATIYGADNLFAHE
jgi:ABC-type transporter Mla MlaB component